MFVIIWIGFCYVWLCDVGGFMALVWRFVGLVFRMFWALLVCLIVGGLSIVIGLNVELQVL